MMLDTLHNVATSGMLMLAGSVQCAMPHAPTISVVPETAPIQYDLSLSSEQLSHQHSDTVSPYPPGTDSTTGGLRVDHPEIVMETTWDYEKYMPQDQICVWYDTIKVSVKLAPHIYIANDYGPGPCRDAILAHEQRHVDVDRDIVNNFSDTVGAKIKETVDHVGIVGPYSSSRLNEVGDNLRKQIKQAVDSQEAVLQAEERQRQAQVDTLQEYQRINNICHMVRQ